MPDRQAPAGMDRRRFALAVPAAVAAMGLGAGGYGLATGGPVLARQDDAPDDPTPSVDEAPPGDPLTDDQIDDALKGVLADLAAAGVAVHDQPGDDAPVVEVPEPGPFRLLVTNARTMAMEAVGGGGIAGWELDDLLGFQRPARSDDPALIPDFAARDLAVANARAVIDVARQDVDLATYQVRPSELLIAWAVVGETAAAEAARRYLPGLSDDGDAMVAVAPATVFPQVVLAMFVGELGRSDAEVKPVARMPSTLAGAVSPGLFGQAQRCGVGGTPAWSAQARSGQAATLRDQSFLDAPCSAVSDFVTSTLSALTSALTRGIDSLHLPGFISGALSWLIGKAIGAITAAIDAVLRPILTQVRAIAAVVGTAVTVVSAIRPWTLRMRTDPVVSRFAIGSEPDQEGRASCLVDLGGLDEWPPYVLDCARAAEIELPSLKPEGAPVVWDFRPSRPGLMTLIERPDELDADGRAELLYVTGRESERTARGPERTGTVEVFATVSRKQFEDLRATILNLAFGALPSIIQPFIRNLLGPVANDLLRKITELTDTRSNTTLYIRYHDEPEPDPTPDPDTGTPGAVSTTFEPPYGHLGTVQLSLDAATCDGDTWDGDLQLVIAISMDETANAVDIDINQTLPISWAFTDGDVATTTVGPFAGSESNVVLGPDTFFWTFDLTITRSTDGADGSQSLSIDGTQTAGVPGFIETVPLEGYFANIAVPIPVTANDAC
ncbi:MAG TPA: hypothetical protein VGT61_01930 [Thermomicrobiales bacterium]|jgi:hypothetical protein|nr:hypothetical protein [Thermomicrobiales bacterium]